jgi:predicted  nucleic acid-binding Zn-ribbon protein
MEELKKKQSSLQERIINVNAIIENIKKSFPYNQMDFLNSSELVEQKKNELTEKINEYNTAYSQYGQKLKELTGGATQ